MKPCINVTIDRELLEQIDGERRKKSLSEQQDISRSAYITNLIRKGLEKGVK